MKIHKGLIIIVLIGGSMSPVEFEWWGGLGHLQAEWHSQEIVMDVSKMKQPGWQAGIELEQGVRTVYQEYCKSGQNRRFG